MKKILIGGSPCTYWSIAQTKGRDPGYSFPFPLEE